MEHLFHPALVTIIEVATTGRPTAGRAVLQGYVDADLIVKQSDGRYALRPPGRELLADASLKVNKAMANEVAKRYY